VNDGRKGHKEMKMRMILVAVAMAMLSSCLMFYTGSEEGPFGVVAERDEPGRPKQTANIQ
jgi:hypothetical protein